PGNPCVINPGMELVVGFFLLLVVAGSVRKVKSDTRTGNSKPVRVACLNPGLPIPHLNHPGLPPEHCAVSRARAFELIRARSVERFLSLPRHGRCSSSDRRALVG